MMEVDKFLEAIGRTPRLDVHHRLASKKLLAAATLKNSLERYDLIIRAAFTMLEEIKSKGFSIDLGRLIVLDNLVQSFLAAEEVNINGTRIKTIPWAFPQTEESFETYIIEWWNHGFEYIPDFLSTQKELYVRLNCSFCGALIADINYGEFLAKVEKPKKSWFHPEYNYVDKYNKCPVCNSPFKPRDSLERLLLLSRGITQPLKITYYYKPIEEPEWEFFFDVTSNALTVNGYQQLLSNFLGYYNEEISEIESKVAKSIDPTIFKEVSMEMQMQTMEAQKRGNQVG